MANHREKAANVSVSNEDVLALYRELERDYPDTFALFLKEVSAAERDFNAGAAALFNDLPQMVGSDGFVSGDEIWKRCEHIRVAAVSRLIAFLRTRSFHSNSDGIDFFNCAIVLAQRWFLNLLDDIQARAVRSVPVCAVHEGNSTIQ